MKISISNIAIKDLVLKEVLPKLKSSGIDGLDIAPGLVWESPVNSTKKERKKFHNLVESHGLEVVGMHALLYNCPTLELFNTQSQREQCCDYLKNMIEICADVKGKVLVLGAAGNRKKGDLLYEEVFSISVTFFDSIAKICEKHGLFFCLEPLASIYGCDFINTVQEAVELVRAVNHPNFRLMADTGSMFLNDELPKTVIKTHIDLIEHIHINDPELYPPGSRKFDHRRIASTLREAGYKKWVAMEFLQKSESLDEDIKYALKCYGKGANKSNK